jgi:hypothetical protein
MKRCSQCDFIFEDEQQICDFDGTELTSVPDPIPLAQKISPSLSTLKDLHPSPIRRFIRSPVSLAVLALAGVTSSALLIGIYDSASEPNTKSNIDLASNSQRQKDIVTLALSPPTTSDQAKPDQVAKPTLISTQRKIRANEKSSSISPMLKWEPVASRSRSSQSRPASRPGPSTSKLEARATSRKAASKTRRANTNREALARSHPEASPIGVKASNPMSTATPTRVSRRSAAQVANRRTSIESDSTRQKRDSKLVAILKKTGRILKRPFEF